MTTTDNRLAKLANELLFEPSFVQEIWKLLEDKRQVVFYGSPGTGKTYVAGKLAACLAESEDRVRTVQFHPSYAYEDFVQGLRPVLDSGQPGFTLRDGPLVQFAKQAQNLPGLRHFLVIDEINRGNLAKVFGELYFLLEYRDKAMRLQYSDEPFSLPRNLFVIGTMNTADRSIALVDLALRRRFHFVEFRPDRPPVRELLKQWLDKNVPRMAWVARLVDQANKELEDYDASIGPSYFMRRDLDSAWLKRIWKHSIIPYVEEHLHGDRERLEAFELDRLLSKIGVEPEDDAPAGETGRRPKAKSEEALVQKAAEFGLADLWQDVVDKLGPDRFVRDCRSYCLTFRKPWLSFSDATSRAYTSHSVKLAREQIRVVFFPVAIRLCHEQFEEAAQSVVFKEETPPNAPPLGDFQKQWVCVLDRSTWNRHRGTLIALVNAVRKAWEDRRATQGDRGDESEPGEGEG